MLAMRYTKFHIFSSIGAQTWVAGIGGPSMFANMSEQAFADIQAVLFPRYVNLNMKAEFHESSDVLIYLHCFCRV